jgi:hypothetical protein
MKDVLIKFNAYTIEPNDDAKSKSSFSRRVKKEHYGIVKATVKVASHNGCSIDVFLVNEISTNKCFNIHPSEIIEFPPRV